MGTRNRNIINVGGSIRSGTTLLNLILANDSKALALGEIRYIFFPNRKQHLKVIKKLKSDPIWSVILKEGPSKLYTNLIKFFPEIDYFIDSSKEPRWYSKQIAYNPNLTFKNVMIFKHPLDQKESLLRRDSKCDWERIIYNYYYRFLAIIPEVRTISLYNLLNSQNSLEKLCHYTGMDFKADKLDYWNRTHPNFYGSDTIKKKKIDSSELREVHVTDEFSHLFIKYKKDISRIYQYLLLNQINMDVEQSSFEVGYWTKAGIGLKSILSDLKFRLKLKYRDYIQDREWLQND